ncbi:MAG: 2-hydroxyacyl-CoA dehydratase family protein [Candidatus Hodarchaeota archaeon]
MEENIITTPNGQPFPYKQYLKRKKEGKKLVGILAHEMIPLELLRSFDLHIVPLIFVGPEEYSNYGATFMTHSACTYARNVLGAFLEGNEFWTGILDYILGSNYCNGDFTCSEFLNHEFHVPLIKTFIPFKASNYSLDFFYEELRLLKSKLESELGEKVDESKIRRSIKLHNELKYLLKALHDLNVHGTELLQRYQEATVLSPEDMIERLKFLYFSGNHELSKNNDDASESAPVLLTGSSIFINDFFGNWLEMFGVDVIYYDTWVGGIMEDVIVPTDENNVLASLVLSYLTGQGIERNVPNSMDLKTSRLSKLLEDHDCKGVINHTLKFCELQAMGKKDIKHIIGERIPILDIERDYSKSGRGGIQTRVEAFVEMILEGER